MNNTNDDNDIHDIHVERTRLFVAMNRLNTQITDCEEKFDAKNFIKRGSVMPGPVEMMGVIIANQLALMMALSDMIAVMIDPAWGVITAKGEPKP